MSKKKQSVKSMEEAIEKLMKPCECGECAVCVYETAVELEKPNKAIFLKQIDHYNKTEQYYSHYIMLDKERIMEISWIRSWHYRVLPLETPIK